MKKLIMLGGGGHARVLIDIIKSHKIHEIAGILDPNLQPCFYISDIPVLGNDDLLLDIYNSGIHNACIGLGSIGNNDGRKRLYEKAKLSRFDIPPIIHLQAVVSVATEYSEGVQIMAGAIVQPGSLIGANTIINTGAIIEHDCRLGKHIHICPGSVVSGGCSIGDGSFIGAGATIIHGIKIGENCLIAAGAVVVGDVPDFFKAMGVPARIGSIKHEKG